MGIVLGLIVSALLIHTASHALTYRTGTAWDADWRSYSGLAVGLAALAAAFAAGVRL